MVKEGWFGGEGRKGGIGKGEEIMSLQFAGSAAVVLF